VQLLARWEWKKRKADEMPPEIKNKLAYTEQDSLGGQLHQATIYEPLITAVAALVALIVFLPRLPSGATAIAWFLFLLFFALLVRLSWKWFEWTHSLYFFTPYRIIYIHGIVTRKIAMLPITKVTDMRYDRTPGGQLLNYGLFIIESAGQEQALRELNFVPDPDQTYKQIQDWLFGKGTTNVNIIDVNLLHPNKAIPTSVRNWPTRGGSGESGGESRRPWWNDPPAR
jgi:membrane protein YdbS with pleckstrin-like domain